MPGRLDPPDEGNLRLHVLPTLGRMKVAAITRPDITNLHHSMRDRPGAANRVLALLSKMFNLAEKWDLRSDGSKRPLPSGKQTQRRDLPIVCC